MYPSNRLSPSYKRVAVIGERIVTPSSIVYLVAKLRILPPTDSVPEVKDEEENTEKEEEFLMSRKDAEDLTGDNPAGGWAHTPYWPGVSAMFLAYG
jgi:translocation protein SEC63